MQSKLVFVYGSLKSGYFNHSLLSNAEFISNHITEAKFTLVNLGRYPAVLCNGKTSIQGEIYCINKATFFALDKLEGYPDFYDRILINTQFGKAWMYTLAKKNKNYPVIESGVWNPEEAVKTIHL